MAATTQEGRSSKGQFDLALLLAAIFSLLSWVELFLFPVSPLIRVVTGPWWGLIWLGPVTYAALRTWKSALPWHRRLILLPVFTYLTFAVLEVKLGWPWWLAHALLAAFLVGLAAWLYSADSATCRYSTRIGALGLAVFSLPWLPPGDARGFWAKCSRLRCGMSVAEVMEQFSDCFMLDPTTQDGCARSPVTVARIKGWHRESEITFSPFDDSNCRADVCFTWFEDGRLVGFWPSPD